ncbi:DUF7544 domain-containing protein [Halosegnis marinus]|uniref:DUF7544 domain-containing protein n=1 Tax=Halosegnis marinus TaxID=3034023 RepID=UPI003616F79C
MQASGGDLLGGLGGLGGVVADLGGRGLNIELLVVAAVALFALLLALAFLYVGSVMEFVLVAALERREVSVREPFGTHRGRGARLFGFRLALFALVVLLVGGAVALGFALQGPGPRLLALLLAVPVALVVVPVVLLVHGLTTVFVVPAMYAERCGVLDGWRHVLPDLRANPGETAAYVLFSVVLSAIGATTIATVVGIIAAVLVLPVGALGLLVGAFTGGIGLVVLAPLFLVVGLAVAAVAAVLRVPVLVYLRHYALFVLADLSDTDLLAGAREATGAAPPGLDDANDAESA